MSTQPVYLNQTLQVGAIVQCFDAGTLTPRLAFKDGLATIPWLQAPTGGPIPPGCLQTDASGCIPVFFLVGNPYRVRITAASGVAIRDVDNLPGDFAAGGGGGGGGGTGLNTGDYIYSHSTASVVPGRVRANGRTIGSATASPTPTERHNADCQALFIFLYTNDPTLATSATRTGNALNDWNAGMSIATPDINGRALFGIDGMGSSPTGRLAGALFATGNATTLGSSGGEGTHALTVAEHAAHNHTGSALANTAFQLNFTTGTAGAHTHTGAAVAVGNHLHAGSVTVSHTHDLSGMTGAGVHNHGAVTTGANTSFQMNTVGVSIAKTFAFTFPTSATGAANFQTPLSNADLNIGLSGTWAQDHAHGINFDGNHVHGGITGASGALTVGITADGAHSHTLSINLNGDHAHSGVTDLGGIHTHPLSIANNGGGLAHNNQPPFVLATCYIVL